MGEVKTVGNSKRRRLLATAGLAAGLALAAWLLAGGAEEGDAAAPSGQSVVVLIGDGMGPAERVATQLNRYGFDETQPMDSLEHAGNLTTHSLGAVTDSTAGATAIATGEKTRNGYAAVDPDGNRLKTLLEEAKDLGKSTGLVSDHDITNATMAAFGAHVTNRDHKKKIARQFAYRTRPDVMMGGGEKTWYTPKDKDKIPDVFDDDANNGKENLVAKLQGEGYEYAYDRETVAGLNGPKALALVQDDAYLIGHEVRGYNRREDPHFVPEEDLVEKALELLSQNPKGFFLAIEVDELDDAGHEHDGRTAIAMGQLVNRITEKVQAYQETDPNTLLVVTADHETGGMTIEGPLMRSGDSAPDGDVPGYGKPQNVPLKGGETPKRWGPFSVKDSSRQFKVDWTTPGHTGTTVPVTASGPGAARLSGVHDNTHVHDVASDVLNGSP